MAMVEGKLPQLLVIVNIPIHDHDFLSRTLGGKV